jgi:PIN domain nuclease of toxin-antitoxin system
MAEEINRYVIDACALIAFLQNESGGDELRELFKVPENEFFMHSVNLTEVYYDAMYPEKRKRRNCLKKLPDFR